MGEWMYSSAILDLGIRCRQIVSSRLGRFTSSTHWIGGWVGPNRLYGDSRNLNTFTASLQLQ
jgi:hypothetical protein